MLGTTYDTQICSAARALEVVGERWTLLILRDAAFAGSRRYSDFQSLGISTNVLKTRLERLVEVGLMRHTDGDYVLTEKGRDFVPTLMALTQWGDKWNAPDGRPIIYTHESCGGEVSIAMVCDHDGVVHDPAEVQVRFGPGMPNEVIATRSVPM
jgi:DNA-binding HxlR family transcriptional regulator